MWQRWVVFFYSHKKRKKNPKNKTKQNKKTQVIGLKHHSKPNRLSEHFRAASICSIWIFAFLAATWLMWLKRLKKKVCFSLDNASLPTLQIFCCSTQYGSFFWFKTCHYYFHSIYTFKVKGAVNPPKKGSDRIFLVSLLIMNSSIILPTISLGRIFTQLFFPDYIQNNLPERCSS